MPIHDWTRVDAGLFHAFHQTWTITLCRGLNAGVLPSHYFALPEQNASGPIPDVMAPPRTRLIQRTEADCYLSKVNRITVRHRHGKVVAVIEIVSPGNKGNRAALRAFVEKVADLIQVGVHVLVIDLFPPTKRDPQGIHKAIWDEFEEVDFQLPPDKPLTLVSYDAGPIKTAYVEPVAAGNPLPDMPLFLQSESYVPAPLETSYQAAWSDFPAALKGLLE